MLSYLFLEMVMRSFLFLDVYVIYVITFILLRQRKVIFFRASENFYALKL